ncbi:MAG: hypothetical protein MUC87_03325 [Bacteroidia bacterium]|jgi:hypothetical protein|nr:hypothetical protein [Bacteroidia bacterium]
MNTNNILASALGLLLLAGCGTPAANEKAAVEAEKLAAVLGSADSILNKVDAEKAEDIARQIKNNSQFIQSSIPKMGDTLDFNTALFLTDYRSLYKNFEVVEKNHGLLRRAIDSTRINLGNLVNDLRSNSLNAGITPDSAVAYEARQASQLYAFAGDIQKRYIQASSQYDTLVPRVNQYLELIKTRTGNVPMPLPPKGEKEGKNEIERY